MHPPAQPIPKPTPLAPRSQQPIDARKPQATEDVHMKDVQRIPYKPSNIPQTKPRNPPTHETVKETSDRPRAPA